MGRIRVGTGSDLHAFSSSGELKLGGVLVERGRSLKGHSDGDVVIHAVIDALLGAAGMDDIGTHFPDSDPAFRGMDSKILLERTVGLLEKSSWELVNLDLTLLLTTPRMAPYRERIVTVLSQILKADSSKVNVKFKTANGIGPVGRGEAAECRAAVCIQRVSSKEDK